MLNEGRTLTQGMFFAFAVSLSLHAAFLAWQLSSMTNWPEEDNQPIHVTLTGVHGVRTEASREEASTRIESAAPARGSTAKQTKAVEKRDSEAARFMREDEVDAIPYPLNGIDLAQVAGAGCGSVRFDVWVAASGQVRHVKCDQSAFTERETAAIAAILRRTLFAPAYRRGTPVDAVVPLELVVSGSGHCE